MTQSLAKTRHSHTPAMQQGCLRLTAQTILAQLTSRWLMRQHSFQLGFQGLAMQCHKQRAGSLNLKWAAMQLYQQLSTTSAARDQSPQLLLSPACHLTW